ncbi:MAG: GIY-YIG nuclease family protein, partial [Candidatus Parcubacteria bacterium]|nr:GIY-YIG nuclease family protein [Candidatus Parcubacteria bacterium]
HGMIYSDNAPGLENTLHKHLENKRLNLVDTRAEFFQATIDEIEQIVKEFNLTVQLTKLAEAKEYRETISIREAKGKEVDGQKGEHKTQTEKQLEKFPVSLG